MDDRSFDTLARRLGARVDRRGVLRGLFGGAVAVAAGRVLLDADDAAAVCGGTGTRCNRDSACCSGACQRMVRFSSNRRKADFGRCAAVGQPLTCEPTGYMCVTTRSQVLQFCQESQGFTDFEHPDCASDAECQYLSPDCGGEMTCFCDTGLRRLRNAYTLYGPWCTALQSAQLCSG